MPTPPEFPDKPKALTSLPAWLGSGASVVGAVVLGAGIVGMTVPVFCSTRTMGARVSTQYLPPPADSTLPAGLMDVDEDAPEVGDQLAAHTDEPDRGEADD